jgi:hypothetical protein
MQFINNAELFKELEVADIMPIVYVLLQRISLGNYKLCSLNEFQQEIFSKCLFIVTSLQEFNKWYHFPFLSYNIMTPDS